MNRATWLIHFFLALCFGCDPVDSYGENRLIYQVDFPKKITLHQKDPVTWQIVPSPRYGILKFDPRKGFFQLEAQGLQYRTEYALVQHQGKTGQGHIVVTGRTDSTGQLFIQDHWPLWKGKFWLVPRTDVEGKAGDSDPGSLDRLKGWHPEHYLFESEVL